MKSGQLNNRAAFHSPLAGKDAAGQIENGFAAEFIVWANVVFRRGGEGVFAARLEAKSPAIITVRASTESLEIRPSWAVDIGGERFNVRERPRFTDDRLYLEFLAETGGAV